MTSGGARVVEPRKAVAARSAFAAGLLGAACVIGAAVPLSGSLDAALGFAAAGCVVLGTARLWLGAPAEVAGFPGPVARIGSGLAALVRAAPWAEATVVAVLVLEAVHPSRPWHTALLGAALLAYLLAVHLAESRAGWPRCALRPRCWPPAWGCWCWPRALPCSLPRLAPPQASWPSWPRWRPSPSGAWR